MKKISFKRIGEYVQTAFRIIVENGGSYPSRDIISELQNRLDFTEYELERYAKTGYIRWQSILHLYSIDCAKAGWLKKNKGVWHITNDGEKALNMDPEEFIVYATKQFRMWKKENDRKEEVNDSAKESDDNLIEKNRALSYEQSLEISRREIEGFIEAMQPYDFQDLCAALLRGMGYYTPFIAAKGPDGGVDIIAYKDPLGAEGARIKVQVKHRKDMKVARQEVASLGGVLKQGEIGLIISSGGFSKESLSEMSRSNSHIEKIDLDDFINLWEKYYNNLPEEDKALMPFRQISFLAPRE